MTNGMALDLGTHNLLVLSDLHLSEGMHPATKKYSTKEDFFFDHEFARFLAYYQEFPQADRRPWHLVINGDFLDFLQVTAVEDAPAELRRGRHLRYGLDCGEQETVYKLHKIVEGHGEFFAALGEFVAHGNALTVIKGNHDVEFHYSAVRAALIEELRDAYERAHTQKADPAPSGTTINSASVRFSDWFYYEPGLWIEHGHQYDEVNVFLYHLSPLLPKSPKWALDRANEIDLPWGSLFVRYLFNEIEHVEPFADNIKPQTEFIRWLLRRHPMMGLRFAIFDTSFLLEKLRRAWVPAKPSAYAVRKQEHEARLRQLAAESGIEEQTLQYLDRQRARSLLKETSSLGWRIARVLLRWRVLRPLLVLLTVLGALGVVVAVSPLFAAVIPDSVRYLLWDRWNTGASGEFLRHAVAVIRWIVFPIVVAMNAALLAWLFGGRPKREEDSLARAARTIAARLGVKTVLMGHTHDADLRGVGENGEEYFNSGTWTRVFSEEERLIRDDLEFVFAEGVRSEAGLRWKLMRWDDAAQEARPLKLFEEDQPTKRSRRSQRPA